MEAAYDGHINTILNTSRIPPHLLPATMISIAHEPNYYLQNEASHFERRIRGFMNLTRSDEYKMKWARSEAELLLSKPKVCTCTIKVLITLEVYEGVTDSRQIDDPEQRNDLEGEDSDNSVDTKKDCISLLSHCEVYNQLRYGQIKYEQGEPRKYGQLWTEIWLERHWSNQWHKCPNDVTEDDVESASETEFKSDNSTNNRKRKKAKRKKTKAKENRRPAWINNNWFTKWYYKENRHLFDPNFRW